MPANRPPSTRIQARPRVRRTIGRHSGSPRTATAVRPTATGTTPVLRLAGLRVEGLRAGGLRLGGLRVGALRAGAVRAGAAAEARRAVAAAAIRPPAPRWRSEPRREGELSGLED